MWGLPHSFSTRGDDLAFEAFVPAKDRSNLLATDDVMTPRSRSETADHSSTLDETPLEHLESREYQDYQTCNGLRGRSDGLTDWRCAAGFARTGVHRYSGGTRHSCHGIRVGATLAQKSSSNGE
jgi:hypothetical protein